MPRRFVRKPMLEIYFDTDFLNMRSIFSLIASIAVEFDWAVDNAWFAVLCAPEAAEEALAAALWAAAASLEAFAVSLCSLLTWDFRSSIWAWTGFKSVQPAKAITQAAATVALSVVEKFIAIFP